MKLKILLLTLVLSIFVPTGVLASNQDIDVIINGEELEMDVAPQVINSRALVPMRSIFEAMGVNVEWYASTSTIIGNKGNDEIVLQLGNEIATINGREFTIDVPPRVVNGRTLVPTRFVAESLGAVVTWVSENQSVIIKTKLEESVEARANEIKEMWGELKPTFTEVKYEEIPQTTAPYKMGKLTDDTLKNALNVTNFLRFIAYSPSDVILDEQFNIEAQAASVVNAANNKLTHFPVKPISMDEELYELGADGARTSNIGAGYTNIIRSIVEGYMEDGDPSNISGVGHRRWILSPTLKKVGFGFAPNSNVESSYPNYTAMKVFDVYAEDNTHESYDYVSWPARVAMPAEYFNGYFPWSISLNHQKYDNTRIEEIKVELIRVNDNKKWEFYNDSSDGYFNVDTSNFGDFAFAVIFRPKEMPKYKHGDKYKVVISNIYSLDGSMEEISFETTFFDLEE